MKLTTSGSLKDIPAEQWNKLAGDTNPFIQHDFLLALETGDCLQPYGWYPQYLLAWSDDNQLIGTAPAYIKTNSYGEFVFDWAWAEAYQRAGIEYYPKLVIAIPFTPATGPRLLTAGNQLVTKALINYAIETAKQQGLSSVHWLFPPLEEQALIQQSNLLQRFDFQFHWQNHQYKNFDDFLSRLNSKKRKNIKRERRIVQQRNIEIKIFDGEELTGEQWQQLYNFYQITFMKKHGTATLTLSFFKSIAHKLLAILAYHENKMVAAAICIKGKNTLYGRHWGCYEDYNSLHFEVCYYAGIEYCIANQLEFFEPGAQGEHKIARGFLPVKTWSSHWVAHEGFRSIIGDHLQKEALMMQRYGKELMLSSPYKSPRGDCN